MNHIQPSSSAAPGQHIQVANPTTVIKPRPNPVKVLAKALWEEEDFRFTVLGIVFISTLFPSTFILNSVILAIAGGAWDASWLTAGFAAVVINIATAFLIDSGTRAFRRNYKDAYEAEERRLDSLKG